MKKVATVSVLGLTLTLLSDKPVSALTATDNIAVSATVTSSCTIVAAPVNFGTYDVAAAGANDATGSVTITCTNGAPVWVALGQGSNAGAGSTDAAPVRQMSAGGTDRLGYALYSNAGRTTTWGNTQGTGVAQTGNGAAQILTVYGRIPALQGVASGAYTDSVLATVNY